MLGWFRPQAPLAAREKAWTETRMQRLADYFGAERLLKSEVRLPTESLWEPGGSQSPTAEDWLQPVRAQLPRQLATVPLSVAPDEKQVAGPSGCGECGETEDHASACARDRHVEVASALQKLARAALVRDSFQVANESDLEATADLAALFSGWGVWAANTATGRRALPVRVWGYALALFAWVRQDQRAAWAEFLRPDPLINFRAGLRFLQRGGESLFRLETLHARRDTAPLAELVRQLRSGTPAARIAALWSLTDQGPAAAEAVKDVMDCAQARDLDLRAEAVGTLASFGVTTPELVERLLDAMHDPQEMVRAAAARSLGRLSSPTEEVVRELAEALRDDAASVSGQASESLGRIGPAAEVALPQLLQALRSTLIACNERRAQLLVRAIQAIASNAESRILDFLAESDQDLRHVAVDVLEQMRLAQNA